MSRTERIDDAGGGLPSAALRSVERPAIARQAGPGDAPDESDLWGASEPESDTLEAARSRRRREEPGLRWWAVPLRPFSPVDVALALSVVVLLVAMVVVAVALTNHV